MRTVGNLAATEPTKAAAATTSGKRAMAEKKNTILRVVDVKWKMQAKEGGGWWM